jgi:hypothetical protein
VLPARRSPRRGRGSDAQPAPRRRRHVAPRRAAIPLGTTARSRSGSRSTSRTCG